jgi:hypothetical protein
LWRSPEPAYEIEGLRGDGAAYTVEILGAMQSEAEAVTAAQRYADLWHAAVKLYRVPFVHSGSAPWAADEMHFICRLEPNSRGQPCPLTVATHPSRSKS